jgi:hypothetical protein
VVLEPKTLVGTVAANLMLKLDAGVAEAQRVLFDLLAGSQWPGLALFGCGGIIYAFLLRQVPLDVAVSFTVARFVAVILAAGMVLEESISLALAG